MTQWSATELPAARAFRYEPERVAGLRTRHPYSPRMAETRLRQLRYG